MPITTAQIRGARGILNWSKAELAERAGLSGAALGSIESGQSAPRESTLNNLQRALESAGVEFIGFDGIRLQSNYMKTLSGADGFNEFLDDVHQTAIKYGTKEKPTEVFLSNVAHENWTIWAGKEKWQRHVDRMVKDQDVMDVRIIVREGDVNFPASSYSQYRSFPENLFNDNSFYSYHDKLAFLSFDSSDVKITIMKQREFAEGYRNLFRAVWETLPNCGRKDKK